MLKQFQVRMAVLIGTSIIVNVAGGLFVRRRGGRQEIPCLAVTAVCMLAEAVAGFWYP